MKLAEIQRAAARDLWVVAAAPPPRFLSLAQILRSYFRGCTVTLQVLWYSKNPPKAGCVFTASSLNVCVPTDSGWWTMPMPWNQMIELIGGKLMGIGGVKKNAEEKFSTLVLSIAVTPSIW